MFINVFVPNMTIEGRSLIETTKNKYLNRAHTTAAGWRPSYFMCLFSFIASQPWWHHFTSSVCLLAHRFCGLAQSDIINTTKNIQWSKVAADIQVIVNSTVVKTGAFVSENVWGSDLFQASVISTMFLVAYWSIIYLDSSQPGVNPPSPFAAIARKK